MLNGSGAVTHTFLNGPGANQALADDAGPGNVTWMLADDQGSVRDVIDGSGAVLDHIEYDSYGNTVSQTSPSNEPRFGYAGMQLDPLTGLYYDHARYYDPSTGRFLSTDPSGFSAGDANLYRYVNNSPLDNTDPTGLCADGTNASTDQNGAMTEARLNQIVAQAKADLAISNGTATADDLRVRRDEAVSEGMSQQQADAAIAPLVSEASARANQQNEDARYANGDLTASEKLQGSGAILANTFTFGGSDAAGWTQSTRYQGDGFDYARIGATASRDAPITLVTAGTASWASAGGLVGDAALTANYAGRGYLAYQSGGVIGSGINDISDGNYGSGTFKSKQGDRDLAGFRR